MTRRISRRCSTDPAVTKIFHYARFDVAVLKHYLGVDTAPLYCTKIASKLTRTYTDRHGLKDLVKELLGIELNKQQQSSDWGAHVLSDAQKQYAAQDVLYLHELKARLDQMLEREGRERDRQGLFRLRARPAPRSIWRAGPRKMSSPTDNAAAGPLRRAGLARRAAAGWRPALRRSASSSCSWPRPGCSQRLLPERAAAPPPVDHPDQITATNPPSPASTTKTSPMR